jgi:chloride channel protein, CIC family
LYQGILSLRGLLVQYVGGAITLMFGLSMGREGPAVHLGSASGSLLGQWAQLPNNSVRVLTGCGCAAAISASFNTPIAGVVFAMEVVMMEYHVATFIPIILAAVVGASLTRAIYGDEVAFAVPPVDLQSLLELPFVMAGSLLIGCMASALIFLSRSAMTRTVHWPLGWRFLLAGAITSLCAMLAPEIMGVGYDTVDAAIAGQLGVTALLTILLLKLIATSACVGAGLPGGVIGPMLLLGAMAGGLIGTLGTALMPDSDGSLYVLLGMAAMMSATLQAPLAGLMALLELTANPNIIFPGMLAVVTSCLVTSQVFRQKGIFHALLGAQGIQLRVTPLSHQLQSVGVAAVMNRSVARVARHIALPDLRKMLEQKPQWLLIEQDTVPSHYMPAADVALHLTQLESTSATVDALDLLEIPGARDNINAILMSATLKEALDQMKQQQLSALYVHWQSAPGIFRVQGLLRRDDIEHYYQL